MEFRTELKIEVEDQSDDFATKVPITVHVIYRGGRWSAQCLDPAFSTELCDTMEEAIVQSGKEAVKALAAT